MEGKDVEVDKMIIEVIGDLLMYLVCNLVDYGMEMLVDCLVKGKC